MSSLCKISSFQIRVYIFLLAYTRARFFYKRVYLTICPVLLLAGYLLSFLNVSNVFTDTFYSAPISTPYHAVELLVVLIAFEKVFKYALAVLLSRTLNLTLEEKVTMRRDVLNMAILYVAVAFTAFGYGYDKRVREEHPFVVLGLLSLQMGAFVYHCWCKVEELYDTGSFTMLEAVRDIFFRNGNADLGFRCARVMEYAMFAQHWFCVYRNLDGTGGGGRYGGWKDGVLGRAGMWMHWGLFMACVHATFNRWRLVRELGRDCDGRKRGVGMGKLATGSDRTADLYAYDSKKE